MMVVTPQARTSEKVKQLAEEGVESFEEFMSSPKLMAETFINRWLSVRDCRGHRVTSAVAKVEAITSRLDALDLPPNALDSLIDGVSGCLWWREGWGCTATCQRFPSAFCGGGKAFLFTRLKEVCPTAGRRTK